MSENKTKVNMETPGNPDETPGNPDEISQKNEKNESIEKAIKNRERCFGDIKKNKKDKINKYEWCESIKLGYISEIFFDILSIDGYITKEIFCEFLKMYEEGHYRERREFGFKMLDLKDKGFVSKKDFIKFYSSIVGVIETLQDETIFIDSSGIENTDEHLYVINENEQRKEEYLDKQFYRKLILKDDDVYSYSDFKKNLRKNKPMLQSIGDLFKVGEKNESYKNIEFGERITFGDQRFDFILKLKTGISQTIDKLYSSNTKEKKFWVGDSKKKGYGFLFDKATKNHKFVAFCPKIFAQLRDIYKVSDKSFLYTLGMSSFVSNLVLGDLLTMSFLPSPGKSKSSFYYSNCGKYILKTITSRQAHLLIDILPQFLKYLIETKNETLLTRYYGLFKCENTFLIVMENVFQTNKKLEIYDLKGSQYGRKSKDEMIIKKDLDFINNKEYIKIHPTYASTLCRKLIQDTQFLKKYKVMDYSFLLGIYKVKKDVKKENDGGIPSHDGKLIYYYGIIDHLISYGIKKKAESISKSILFGKKANISSVNPDKYADRFLKFMASRVIAKM